MCCVLAEAFASMSKYDLDSFSEILRQRYQIGQSPYEEGSVKSIITWNNIGLRDTVRAEPDLDEDWAPDHQTIDHMVGC